MSDQRLHLTASLGFWLLMALAWLLLSQGLGGNFIFDDSWNLRGLEEIRRNPSVVQALHYVLNGFSSTLGRPLALATFAIQYPSWPEHPSDFQRFNILFHLLAGCLMFWWLLRLTRLLRLAPEQGASIALLGLALWLLAPLQGSAVLYVVQRMAVLSGLFMFLGLLLYTVGRERLVHDRTASGLSWCTAGISIGTVLGVMAKENAALLPLSILVLEFTLLAQVQRGRAWRVWAALFLLAPTLMLGAYLGLKIPAFMVGFQSRDFSLGERLLTEGRVLFIYLYKLAVPSISSIRLLYDDLVISTSLLSPLTTLLSTAGWGTALFLSLRFRRRAPWLSFAVLWFLANHLLESTIVPLELAFEHRNYVASVGPVLAAAWGIHWLLAHARLQRLRLLLMSASGAYLFFVGTALWLSASLWAHPSELFQYWGKRQPDSPRAQMTLSDTYFLNGNTSAAVATMERAMNKWPGDLAFTLAFLQFGCVVQEGPVPTLDHFRQTAARFSGQVLASINILDRLLTAVENGYCRRYSSEDWYQLLDIVSSTPAFDGQRRNLFLLRSRVAEAAGDRAAAVRFLDDAIAIEPLPILLAHAATWALQAGDLDGARRYAQLAEEQLPVNPLQRWSARENARLLREEIDRVAANRGDAMQRP